MSSDLSLYKIEDHVQALLNTLEMVDDPGQKAEITEDIRRALEAEVRKVDGVAAYLSQCAASQAACKAEIERIRGISDVWAGREKRVRSYVQGVMEQFDLPKLEGATASFSLRAVPSSVVIVDESAIPEIFKRTTVVVDIDKKGVAAAIKAGQDVPGADLSMGGKTLVRK